MHDIIYLLLQTGHNFQGEQERDQAVLPRTRGQRARTLDIRDVSAVSRDSQIRSPLYSPER